jgi:hypothetical protein
MESWPALEAWEDCTGKEEVFQSEWYRHYKAMFADA